MKELFIAAHEELVEKYLLDHPEADWNEACERFRAALREIIERDQRECRNVIEIDPSGNTYAIKYVDGPLAMIARRALTSGERSNG